MIRLHLLALVALLSGIGFSVGTHAAPTTQSSPNPQAAPSQGSSLDALVGPIALYPDPLVLQILQCSTSPFQVRAVNDWLTQNPNLRGSAAQDAATKQGFDTSFVAIVLFPDVLGMMASKPDWTKQLGEAFTSNRDGIFDSIQRLRSQAMALGNLATTPQQTVKSETTDSGQSVIVIQPANPQVVYVPQYNPQVVYVQPAPTTTAAPSGTGAAAAVGFAAGVVVGALADNDSHNYYYHAGGWGYPRPVLYGGGYNAYTANRQQAANDYYQHRENMASQAGWNQGQRQDAMAQNQSQRQDAASGWQGTASQNQAQRQDAAAQRQGTATQNQAQRQDAAAQRQGDAWQNQQSRQSQRGSADEAWNRTGNARGASFGADGTSRSGGAFSGYQSGGSERASSQRGWDSMSRSGGGFEGRSGFEGGGGYSRGGGFSRGGGGRRR